MTLDTIFLNNPLSAWLKAGGTALAVCALLVLLRRFALGKIRRSDQKITPALDLARDFKGLTILILSLAAGAAWLEISDTISAVARVLVISAAGIQVGFWLSTLVEHWIDRQFALLPGDDARRRSSIRALGVFFRVLIWLIIGLVILDNIPNFDLASMITGLGIGGIAIGLAAQNFVSDLLSSLTISLDKPFVVGDSIQVGDFVGTVEAIGIKSTRLRALSGEQLIISNSELLASRVQNFQQMEERRVAFSLRLDYDTPTADLARLPEILREEIETVENVRFARAHLKSFGEVALIVEVVYFVSSAEFAAHIQAQHAINLAIHARLAKENIRLSPVNQNVKVRQQAD